MTAALLSSCSGKKTVSSYSSTYEIRVTSAVMDSGSEESSSSTTLSRPGRTTRTTATYTASEKKESSETSTSAEKKKAPIKEQTPDTLRSHRQIPQLRHHRTASLHPQSIHQYPEIPHLRPQALLTEWISPASLQLFPAFQ